MDKVYPCLYYGVAGMYIGFLVIEWVVLESKFIKEYHKTSSKIHLVMLAIITVLIMLMCLVTKHILLFFL